MHSSILPAVFEGFHQFNEWITVCNENAFNHVNCKYIRHMRIQMETNKTIKMHRNRLECKICENGVERKPLLSNAMNKFEYQIIICSNETIFVVWILNAWNWNLIEYRMQWHWNVRYALTWYIITMQNHFDVEFAEAEFNL